MREESISTLQVKVVVLRSTGKQLTILRPRTEQSGPQIQVLSAMNTRYTALLKLIMDPVVWNVAATSGIALRTVVEDIGDNTPHHAITATMRCFRCDGNLS